MVKNRGFTHESAKSQTVEWYTPASVFEMLRWPSFDLDPCSPGALVVPWIPAADHYTTKEDGLSKSWSGRVWLNPPYGRQTAEWLLRLKEHGDGIALVFARTDTLWFQTIDVKAEVLVFPAGRIQFIRGVRRSANGMVDCRHTQSATCGSVFLAYGKECADILRGVGNWTVDQSRQYSR